MNDRNRFARHPKLTLTLTALISSMVLLCAVELAARLFFPQWAPAVERVVFLQYDPLLGWSHRPGQQTRFVQREFSVDVEINALGMRDTEYAEERGARRRMLVIGDSFAWGFGVEHSERFTEILETSHYDWEIMNASVNGYGTDQELLYLRDRGFRLQPDVILMLLHANDFENNASAEQYWYNKPRFTLDGDSLVLRNVPVPSATWRQLMKRHLIGRTYIGEALRKLRRSFLSQRAEEIVMRATSVEAQENLRLTSALVERVARVCKEAGVRLVLASAPMPEQKIAAATEAARRAGVDYLPLDSALSSAEARVTFDHDEHWTPFGHEVAATAIGQFLVSIGVFEQ